MEQLMPTFTNGKMNPGLLISPITHLRRPNLLKMYKFIKIVLLIQQQIEEQEVSRDAKSKAQKKPDVTLYTKNDCADCDKAREFLKSKNFSFTEYNMDKDKTAAAKRKDIDYSEDVPFAIINKNHVYGFSESVYNRALKPSP